MWRTIQCRLAPSNAHSYLTQYVLLVSFSHYFQRCIAKCCQLVKRTHTHTTDTLTSSFQFKSIQNGLLAYKQPTRKKLSQQLLTTAKNDNDYSALSFYGHELRMRFRSDAANEPNMVIVFHQTLLLHVVLKETFYACSHMAHRIHRQLQ